MESDVKSSEQRGTISRIKYKGAYVGGPMFCRLCLYDLSHTTEPRCPECGGAFTPGQPDTMLPTDSRWKWLQYHAGLYVAGVHHQLRRDPRKFCRECYSDLQHEPGDHCPVCRTWFDARDSSTFRRSDHALTRLYHRFRHICIWRGVLLALIPLCIGLEAILTQSTLLPAGGHRAWCGRMLTLHGCPAISMGIGWMGAFLMLHSRYFWHRVEPFWRYAGFGFYGGACMILCGWIYAVYCAVMGTMG